MTNVLKNKILWLSKVYSFKIGIQGVILLKNSHSKHIPIQRNYLYMNLDQFGDLTFFITK